MRGAGHDIGGARRLSRLLLPLLLLCLSASVAWAATPDLLIDQFGKPVPPGRLQGHVLLVYFGYTNCPDLCPAALTTMTSVMNLLGPEGADVLPVFVSVDPARDTVALLRHYATHFHPRLVALTGTAAAIADAARSFNVQYQAQPVDAHGYYAVDHSVLLYLADRQGRVVQSFHPRQSAQEIAAAVRARLTAESRVR